MTYRQAVTAALDDALRDDGAVLLMGEDVADAGGVFKTSEGLWERYGSNRVINTPICENGFVGVALGMAVAGARPVVEIMFSDFLAMAADSIVNELPKFRFMSGGNLSVPVTIRAIGGATGGFGAQHSATGESWFLQVAGLRIAVAGSPGAAYSILRCAISEDNPVLVIEHKGMYNIRGSVERGAVASLGCAEVVRSGEDITIVASLLMLERSLAAANALEQRGVSAEVIDVRWLRPLDHETIRSSVERTGSVLVVAEEPLSGGWGASVIAELAMRGVTTANPPRFLGLSGDLPIPFSPPLEVAALPDVGAVADSAMSMLGRRT